MMCLCDLEIELKNLKKKEKRLKALKELAREFNKADGSFLYEFDTEKEALTMAGSDSRGYYEIVITNSKKFVIEDLQTGNILKSADSNKIFEFIRSEEEMLMIIEEIEKEELERIEALCGE